jgi:hypothetical protein
VPEALREFLNDDLIVLYGAAIVNDINKLDYYDIDISVAVDFQQVILNPTRQLGLATALSKRSRI